MQFKFSMRHFACWPLHFVCVCVFFSGLRIWMDFGFVMSHCGFRFRIRFESLSLIRCATHGGFCVFHASNGIRLNMPFVYDGANRFISSHKMLARFRVLYAIFQLHSHKENRPMWWNGRRNGHSNWKLCVLIMRCLQQSFNDIIFHWRLTQTCLFFLSLLFISFGFAFSILFVSCFSFRRDTLLSQPVIDLYISLVENISSGCRFNVKYLK